MTSLNNAIDEFERVLKSRKEGYVARAESVLEVIAGIGDASCISRLIGCMDDDEESYELMFSIIHTIEMFDQDEFIDHLVSSLPSFVISAPEWATIIHTRILNSRETLEAYGVALKEASAEERNSVKSLLRDLVRKKPKFQKRVEALLGYLG